MNRKGFKAFKDAIVKLEGAVTDSKYVSQAGEFALAAAKMECSGFRISSGELRNSLNCVVKQHISGVYAHVGTNKEYAAFVEFGTGPKGAAHHSGAAPDIEIAYSMSPWWIHESQVSRETAEVYGWFHIDTEAGRFYRCSGQPAHPYLYPAFRNNQKELEDILAKGFEGII